MTILALCLLAGEIVTLTNGFELKVDRHEIRGEEIVLVSGAGETVLPRTAITSIEQLFAESTPQESAQMKDTEAVPLTLKQEDPLESAAVKHGLPTSFVRSVAKVESAFNPKAVSPKGAIGMMQLMPKTAQALGVNPRDVHQNAEGGARLLRDLLIQYKDHPDQVRLALAAYNAGTGAVKKYNGIPPYRETQNYVDKVIRNYTQSKSR
jgi:soluble lytic murein transglycosylase-like protein